MRFHALACSYDSTIAGHGRVDPATTAALRRVVASGRHLILLSRRPLPELLAELPSALFVMVVADNGAVLYHPDTEQIEHLVPDPAAADKTVGLRAALTALGLSPRNLVAVGAAANDLAYLQHAEFSVAVANAAMALREQVDHVTTGEAGAGVSELVTALITGDLASLKPRRPRRILVGANLAGTQFTIPVHGTNLLLAGTSGSGKSTLMTGLLERINIQGYQFCALDPEGDHQHFPGADHFGDRHHAPPRTTCSPPWPNPTAASWSTCSPSDSRTCRCSCAGYCAASKSCAPTPDARTGCCSKKPTTSSRCLPRRTRSTSPAGSTG